MDFSIVICTYNPSKKMLERALRSCTSQTLNNTSFEIIIVDNNSAVPVSGIESVKQAVNDHRVVCVREPKQGLVYARLLGIKTAKFNFIVFVDDDNELSADYLANLSRLAEQHPAVEAWGPGVITLDFIDGVPGWIKKHFSGLYQQKKLQSTRFGAEIEWQEYYPAGSGLSVSKKMLEEYARGFYAGEHSATGRQGDSLSSAEDSQIVWTAIKNGGLAGTSPLLQLTHIIPYERTNLAYLKKLNYGISYSYYTALREMFPQYKLPFGRRNFINKAAFFVKTFVKAGCKPLLFYRMYAIDNAWLRGFDDYAKQVSDKK
jgi:glycosyltransferase involved in cell wall biosynthesis